MISGQNSYPLPRLHPRSVPGLPMCLAGIRRLPWHYIEVPPGGWWMSPGVWLAVGSCGPCKERWAFLTAPPHHPDQPIPINYFYICMYISLYETTQEQKHYFLHSMQFFNGSRQHKKYHGTSLWLIDLSKYVHTVIKMIWYMYNITNKFFLLYKFFFLS